MPGRQINNFDWHADMIIQPVRAKKDYQKALAKKAKPAQIQTLHPDPDKTNKKIALEKYTVVRKQLLSILRKKEYTHTALMEALYQKLKDGFEGGVQWYGETVKLDLEARQLIERTGKKPDTYRLCRKGDR